MARSELRRAVFDLAHVAVAEFVLGGFRFQQPGASGTPGIFLLGAESTKFHCPDQRLGAIAEVGKSLFGHLR